MQALIDMPHTVRRSKDTDSRVPHTAMINHTFMLNSKFQQYCLKVCSTTLSNKMAFRQKKAHQKEHETILRMKNRIVERMLKRLML